MKNIFAAIAFIFVAFTLNAQTPQALNYQAIARNNTGNPIVNQSVSVKISIIQGSITGSSVYSETHKTTTNQLGLFNLQIGNGTAQNGVFANINWGASTFYSKVEIDANGGSNYQILGTSQMLSVPYALLAKKVENESQSLSINGNTLAITGTGGNSVTLPSGGNNASETTLRQCVITGFSGNLSNGSVKYINSICAMENGKILFVGMGLQQGSSGVMIVRLEKDQNGLYHATHATYDNSVLLNSMVVIGQYLYYVTSNPTKEIRRTLAADLTTGSIMNFNPVTPNFGSLATDGTNLLIPTFNISSGTFLTWKTYQIISTALIDTNQDFKFPSPTTGFGENAVFDGKSYFVATSAGIAKFDLNKNFLLESSGRPSYIFADFGVENLVSCELLVNTVSNANGNQFGMPIIITNTFKKP